MEYEMEPIKFVTADSHKHTMWPLCSLIVRCQILLWSGSARIHPGNKGKQENTVSAALLVHVSGGPTIGGMDGVEEMNAG